MSRFSVRGRRAVVTGGSRGLGQAMVRGLLEEGADVVSISRNPPPESLFTAANGGRLFHLACDLADRPARANLIERAAALLGGVDILVNNAGVQDRAPVLEYPQAQWDLDLELLLTSMFDLSQQAGRCMMKQGTGGKIVQIASISSFQGARGIVGYSSAKHAVVGLTKCFANELAGHGINVNAIAPGLFETDMASHVTADTSKSDALRGRIPAGRFGRPDDLIGPLLFLTSDASAHVHGHILLVDGGWMGR